MKKIFIVLILLVLFYLLVADKNAGPNVSQNGISVDQFAREIMAKYDKNADGKLDVAQESFLRTKIQTVTKTESRGLLFTDADAFGNKNGSVDEIELINYLEAFDTDGDGDLTTFKNIFHSIINGKNEYGRFDDKYTEKFKYD